MSVYVFFFRLAFISRAVTSTVTYYAKPRKTVRFAIASKKKKRIFERV